MLAPHGERENAAELDAFRKDAAELVKDESDGLWPNAGGSAYFAWALISGVRRGWLDPAKYGPIARRAWLARVRAVVTFPNDTEAKAAALLAANALNRR